MTSHAAWHLTELASGYWHAAAIGSAASLGVFDKLTEPRTADEVAAACATDPAYTADLLRALAAMGLLEQRNDLFVIAADYLPLFDPASERCMIEALRLNGDLYGLWGRLGQCVKDGRPAIPPGAHLGGDARQTRRFVRGMHSRAMALGEAIIPRIDVSGCRSLLDVGSGPGTFSRMLAQRQPELVVTQFDLPAVIEVARELTEGQHVADRIRFHPGDYRTDALPEGFDAALYCGALHQETSESARALFERLRAVLRPDGRVIVIDFMRPRKQDRADDQAFPALFALQMKLFNPGAGVFAVDAVTSMLEAAGFTATTAGSLEPTAYRLVTARCG